MPVTRRRLLLGSTAALGTAGAGWFDWRARRVRDPRPASVQPPLAGPVPWPRTHIAGMNLAHIHDRGRGYGSATCREQLVQLAAMGVTHVVVTPFAFQRALDDVDVQWRDLDRTLTDADLLQCAADASSLGMAVVLKPHIWCSAFGRSGASRQDILPDPARGGWAAWLDSYTAFLVAQARLAAQMDATMLVVGLEYLQATTQVPGAWAAVAQACRAEFGGALTYAANWWQEVDAFADWQAFDVIGVNAYYPLTVAGTPTAASVAQAWAPHLTSLGALAAREDRKIVFLEAGLPAVSGALTEPWNSGLTGAEDLELQAIYVDGLMRAALPQPWFSGVCWWKWHTDAPRSSRHHGPEPYRLADRPAADRIKAWWTA